MKKQLLYFCIFSIYSFAVKAQEGDSIHSEGPFSEARYHYFLKTLVFFNEYLDTDSGSYNTTQLRLLYPIGNKAWNLRFDFPLVSTNSDTSNQTGIGDIGAGISYIPYMKHNNGISLRARVISNSASSPSFGTGKWVFIPAFFFARYLKNKKYLWISSLEYQRSFAGYSNRNDVNVLALENSIFLFFGRNWIAADAAVRYNKTLDGFQNNAYLELGRKISNDDLVYIHPSIAFGNQKSYNWGLEVGFLVLF
ncbi:lipid A phosphoethanolamine transferase [Flavobacterium fluviatile]|uniref:lipid A phosphoethanolamine transferase n=1 Tax=Flavobacterium fluviatile TaxID=1862387 RepID=UPI0013D447C2|nr:lipid A phosphoethanolamine transferase [Flavobacterium fluviatile]